MPGGPATAVPTTRERSSYRHDLDGLRAVAILLVAAYHVWFHRVSGGVDIFLLVSGFFVGGGLLRGFAAGRPVRLRNYLPRLARRLLPVLIVVLAATMVAAGLWLPRTQWIDVARQTLASAGYFQNWYLATTGQQYGAADVGQSPLQHVWSMSVQGQLFVGMPALLLVVWWLTRRARPAARLRAVHTTVVTLAAASFVYATVGVLVDQAFTYYDTAARAWEYLAGTLLAMALPWLARRRLPGALLTSLGWTGLAVVAVAGVLVDGGTQFPGPWTLVPLAGAALLVVAGGSGTPGRRSATALLSRRPVAAAGRYAYAFYLWHWPVLVFTIAVRDRPVGWLAGSGVLVLSALLAVLTRHLVEEPLRGRQSIADEAQRRGRRASASRRHAAGRRQRPARVLLPATVVVALAAAVVVVPAGWMHRVSTADARNAVAGDPALLAQYPGAMAEVDPVLAEYDRSLDPIPDPVAEGNDKPRAVFDGCGVNGTTSDMKVCSYGDLEADRVLAVVGGSHAEHWVDAVAAVGERRGFRVDSIIKWGCALSHPDAMVAEFADDETCIEWNRQVLEHLSTERPDAVLVTGTRPTLAETGPREYVPEGYLRAFQEIASAGIPVLALRDTPWVGIDGPGCVAEHGAQSPRCAVPRDELLDPVSPLDAVAQSTDGVFALDVDDILCPDGTCPLAQGNRIVYRDKHHLTNTYAVTVAPVLEERMRAPLGWW